MLAGECDVAVEGKRLVVFPGFVAGGADAGSGAASGGGFDGVGPRDVGVAKCGLVGRDGVVADPSGVGDALGALLGGGVGVGVFVGGPAFAQVEVPGDGGVAFDGFA